MRTKAKEFSSFTSNDEFLLWQNQPKFSYRVVYHFIVSTPIFDVPTKDLLFLSFSSVDR